MYVYIYIYYILFLGGVGEGVLKQLLVMDLLNRHLADPCQSTLNPTKPHADSPV